MNFDARDPKRRERILLAVLLLLAPFALWRFAKPVLSDFALGGVGPGARIRSIEPRAVARQPVVEVRLAALEAQGGEYEPERNLFRYGERPKPPPPPPPPRPAPVRTEPKPVPPRAEPAKPKPPPVDVSLIGILGPDRRRVAALTDGELIIAAVEKQVIKDKFIVDRIGFESIDLAFVGFPDAPPARLEIGK